MTLSKKQKREYIKRGGAECPSCGYDDRHFHPAGPPQFVEDGHIELKVICINCMTCWLEEYHLAKISELAHGSVKAPSPFEEPEPPPKKSGRPLCHCGSPLTDKEQEQGKCHYCHRRSQE